LVPDRSHARDAANYVDSDGGMAIQQLFTLALIDKN
jgi:hypothetical protein